MCLGREVVRRCAVPEVGVDHHAEAFELLEVPVHGRGVHIRRELSHHGEQLLGGRVLGALDERGEDQAPGGRHPRAALSQLGHELLDRIRGHVLRIAALDRLPPGRSRWLLDAIACWSRFAKLESSRG